MFQDSNEARVNQQFADLKARNEAPLGDRVLPPSKIPSFEGHVVHGTKVKLAGATNLDFSDQVLGMDDWVKIEAVGRVTRVDYAVNATTGQLFRVHTIKIEDAEYVGNVTDLDAD